MNFDLAVRFVSASHVCVLSAPCHESILRTCVRVRACSVLLHICATTRFTIELDAKNFAPLHACEYIGCHGLCDSNLGLFFRRNITHHRILKHGFRTAIGGFADNNQTFSVLHKLFCLFSTISGAQRTVPAGQIHELLYPVQLLLEYIC